MSDLARYFERYRPSPKSGVTRVTEVTEPARGCNASRFLPKDLSPCKDVLRVTRVTDGRDAMPGRDDAMPGRDTDVVVTPVTPVAFERGDHAGQQQAVLHQQVSESVTSVTHVTHEFECGRMETTDPTRCAWCGEGERSGAMIVPFGTETHGHSWLHSQCWREWYAKRREALSAGADPL